MKKLFILFGILFTLLISLTSCDLGENYDVVVTNFVGYDAVRAVSKHTDINCKMLLKPGNDIHSYEPSGAEIRAVMNAKVFVYVGGESDSEWVESDILGNVKDKDIIIINMFEILEDRLILEDGEEDEYDEHVWTNPSNYGLVVEAVRDALIKISKNDKDIILDNADTYLGELNELDRNMGLVIKNGDKDKIVVADRNPFMYFDKYYGLEIIGALEGCSSDKNIPSSKLGELINVVEGSKLKAIFIIELSDGKIAADVKNQVRKDIIDGKYSGDNVEVLTLYSMQNISLECFNSGLTYNEMFKRNIESIRYALS